MWKLLCAFVFAILIATAAPATAQYAGVLVDAHSQFGCEISTDEIREVVARTAIAYTQVSARGCHTETSVESQKRVLDLVDSLRPRAGFLVSAKLAGMSKAADKAGEKGLASLHQADGRYFARSSGFAAIIVQHAPHDTWHLKFAGADFELGSHRIERVIALGLSLRAPVVLHVELNDNARASQRTLRQLKALAAAHPKADFLLMHMGQASLAESADLIAAHANIHFVLAMRMR